MQYSVIYIPANLKQLEQGNLEISEIRLNFCQAHWGIFGKLLIVVIEHYLQFFLNANCSA